MSSFLSVLLLMILFSVGFRSKTEANNILKYSVSSFFVITEMPTRKEIEDTRNYLMELKNKIISPYCESELRMLHQTQVIECN